MQQQDRGRFVVALDALASLFSRELDEMAVSLYWDAVQALTIEKFEAAVRLSAARCQHFPPPADLITLVDDSKSSKQAALEAWPELKRLASRSSGDHSDPIAAEAIRLMGGGRKLGQMSEAELDKWGKKEFMDLYAEIAAKPEPLMLPGRDSKALPA